MPVMITVPVLAEEMGKDRATLYQWAKRAEDPLPLAYGPGAVNNGAILVSDFEEWWRRNARLLNEVNEEYPKRPHGPGRGRR